MTMTGRRWRRSPRACPEWCARDHRCTAQHGYPSGQHRSTPLRWRDGYGSLAVTRVQEITGSALLEILARVEHDQDEQLARWQAQQLAVGVDLTIRTALRQPLQSARLTLGAVPPADLLVTWAEEVGRG